MRRLLNFLGVIAIGGLVLALAPSPKAFAGNKGGSGKGGTTSSCGTPGSTCNCPPHYAFIAFGNGEAVDDINSVGCYSPGSGDALIPNDDPELTCPTPTTVPGSLVNLACGCLLAGSGNPSPGTDVTINGDTDLGNWKITQLEANFAYGDLNATSEDTFFIGNPEGSATGTNGTRCYGAAGFVKMISTTGSVTSGPVLYLTLQGNICDSMPLDEPYPTVEPQKFSFTGSYIVDPARSDSYYSAWTGSGTFVFSMSNVSDNEYSPSYFSFNGYLLP